MIIEADETVARIITRARIPQGATISSPTLSRSELLMRLGALSDDTRLHILELLAHEAELTTQDIIDALDLSQSSASRHLNQLAATGYLVTRQQERIKYYRLNSDRIDQTFDELKQFVRET
jgi:ArsR family transcriptional regulator